MSSAWRNGVAMLALTLGMADARSDGGSGRGFDEGSTEVLRGFYERANARANEGSNDGAAESSNERADDRADQVKAEYDGRFSFVRLRHESGGGLAGGRFRQREAPWQHDFPRADFHFLKILNELTFLSTFVDQGNILTLDDPDLSLFPIAYMSEPGFWNPNEAEMEGLRGYLKKGGFIIFDDFRGNHMQNLEFQMRRVYPDAPFRKLDATHPIFHSFFEINALDPRSGYYAEMGDTEWLGIFEDNDPDKRLIAIANNNHDLGELWEFSDTGYVPVDLSNEAYKFGVNYVVYAMTH